MEKKKDPQKRSWTTPSGFPIRHCVCARARAFLYVVQMTYFLICHDHQVQMLTCVFSQLTLCVPDDLKTV